MRELTARPGNSHLPDARGLCIFRPAVTSTKQERPSVVVNMLSMHAILLSRLAQRGFRSGPKWERCLCSEKVPSVCRRVSTEKGINENAAET